MKKYILPAVAAVCMLSCGDSAEERAGKLLQQATAAYETADYQSAKILIDSIRTACPTAIEARRSALTLMRDVEMAEQQRSLSYFNEVLAELYAKRDSMLPSFSYEKDERFQSEGSYVVPSQSSDLNARNSFLCARVTESGAAYITSMYRGRQIGHNSVKVSAAGSFVSCDSAFSSRTYSNLGTNNERLDFIYGSDGGIIDFITAMQGEKIDVELAGVKGTYKYRLRPADAKAIAGIASLANVLKSIAEHENMAAEARRHIDFIQKRKSAE